jgi:hypothetical protein
MASEEKYLWLFAYRLHGEKRLWWAYFKDEAAAEVCVERLMWLFPCVERLGLEERAQGLQFSPYYYHYQLSHQKSADALNKKEARARDRQLFPLAPLASDHLSAFVVNRDNVTPCSRCELLSRVFDPRPLELSHSGLDGRREFR